MLWGGNPANNLWRPNRGKALTSSFSVSNFAASRSARRITPAARRAAAKSWANRLLATRDAQDSCDGKSRALFGTALCTSNILFRLYRRTGRRCSLRALLAPVRCRCFPAPSSPVGQKLDLPSGGVGISRVRHGGGVSRRGDRLSCLHSDRRQGKRFLHRGGHPCELGLGLLSPKPDLTKKSWLGTRQHPLRAPSERTRGGYSL